jgi:hypothetical protein
MMMIFGLAETFSSGTDFLQAMMVRNNNGKIFFIGDPDLC